MPPRSAGKAAAGAQSERGAREAHRCRQPRRPPPLARPPPSPAGRPGLGVRVRLGLGRQRSGPSTARSRSSDPPTPPREGHRADAVGAGRCAWRKGAGPSDRQAWPDSPRHHLGRASAARARDD
eukprot:13416527-Alexandrium_andersonii.AAC.1